MSELSSVLTDTFRELSRSRDEVVQRPVVRETGRVLSVSVGIAWIRGLPKVGSDEIVQFEGGLKGIAFNLDPNEVGVILLDQDESLEAGDRVWRTGRVLHAPVGRALLGRVVDALGRPLDSKGALRTPDTLPIERKAPEVLDRAPVTEPLHTGLKVIDSLFPIGRGQRELILGDRQTGKTTLALDAILNQRDNDVKCVYCAVGQRNAAVSGVIEDLREHGSLQGATVVVAGEEDPPGQRYVAPYTAMSIAEYYRDRGEDALVVFDDLSKHARAYRELSLLLRRPPGREAFPGDIFYVHSRLLERSTHLREELGGGSLTALPIIETEAQNISGYIPTNLISITDGQIYLSPDLFQKGILPAVDVGQSVSRVGGKAQLPAYRRVAGDLRLSYSQFEELESFAHFGARLESKTRASLERGERVREILKQNEHDLLEPLQQIAGLLAVTEGLLDDVELEDVSDVEQLIHRQIEDSAPEIHKTIEAGDRLSDDQIEDLLATIQEIVSSETTFAGT